MWSVGSGSSPIVLSRMATQTTRDIWSLPEHIPQIDADVWWSWQESRSSHEDVSNVPAGACAHNYGCSAVSGLQRRFVFTSLQQLPTTVLDSLVQNSGHCPAELQLLNLSQPSGHAGLMWQFTVSKREDPSKLWPRPPQPPLIYPFGAATFPKLYFFVHLRPMQCALMASLFQFSALHRVQRTHGMELRCSDLLLLSVSHCGKAK